MKVNSCQGKKDISTLKNEDQCPFQAYFQDNVACCARWGSATPLISFQRTCTVKDLKECPLTEYPNEASISFWSYWLFKKEISSRDKTNRHKSYPENSSHPDTCTKEQPT